MLTLTISPRWQSDIFTADIEPKKSIRLYGIFYNQVKGARAYDVTFQIGDFAEYDSYNLSYYGKIVAIGEKTVTIEERHKNGNIRADRHRLNLENFASRNWDFDLERIEKENQIESQYI